MYVPLADSNQRPTMERRRAVVPVAPNWGELLVESSWRPSDRPRTESEGWLITHGYAPERRER
jgi:hypothetical protein